MVNVSNSELLTAQITASFGRRYIVRTPDGKTYEETAYQSYKSTASCY